MARAFVLSPGSASAPPQQIEDVDAGFSRPYPNLFRTNTYVADEIPGYPPDITKIKTFLCMREFRPYAGLTGSPRSTVIET